MTIKSLNRLELLIKEIDILPATVLKLRKEISELKQKCAQLENSMSKVEKEIELHGQEQSQYTSIIDKLNKLLEDASSTSKYERPSSIDLKDRANEAESVAPAEEERVSIEGDATDTKLERSQVPSARIIRFEDEDSTPGEEDPKASRGMVGQVEEITHLLQGEPDAKAEILEPKEVNIEEFEDSGFEKDFNLADALKGYSRRKKKGSFWGKISPGKKKKDE